MKFRLFLFLSLQKKKCTKIMSSFGNCQKKVAFNDYVATCAEDMCICTKEASDSGSDSDLSFSCICSTLNQYSRDCVLKGGNPGKWRTKELCCK